MTIGTLMSRDLCYHGYETASRRISGFIFKDVGGNVGVTQVYQSNISGIMNRDSGS